MNIKLKELEKLMKIMKIEAGLVKVDGGLVVLLMKLLEVYQKDCI